MIWHQPSLWDSTVTFVPRESCVTTAADVEGDLRTFSFVDTFTVAVIALGAGVAVGFAVGYTVGVAAGFVVGAGVTAGVVLYFRYCADT